MNFRVAMLMAGASLVAVGSSAYAQEASSGANSQIVVTGSRVATGNQAPTPLTVLPTAQLLATAPTSIGDALDELPQFAGQPAERNIAAPNVNGTGNYLNLRQLGVQRNLVLLDGNRLPPAATSGAVDTNMIPEALVQNVDVVTGGTSAVYGSDAVSGVVNFILNKNFNGLKALAQGGVSTYGDGASWRAGLTGGMSILGGAGHIEGSYEHYDSRGLIGYDARPLGASSYAVTGAGTAANPFTLTANARVTTSSPTTLVTAPTAVAFTDFDQNGVATPFVHGAKTGSPSTESGGDGSNFTTSTLQSPLTTNQVFARADYDFNPDVHFYVEGSYDNSANQYPFSPGRFLLATVLSGDPYLPASLQQTLTNDKINSITVSRINSINEGYSYFEDKNYTQFAYVQTGLEGKIPTSWVPGGWDWRLNYSYGRNASREYNINNVNNQKVAAALDAVVNPATGQIVCHVSLTQYASRYPGCIPLNPFGPTAPSQAAWNYLSDNTFYTLANVQHDLNFSTKGSPISTWAGPVVVSLNAEYRYEDLENNSSVQSTTPIDCTGLRNCSSTTALYSGNVSANVRANRSVEEGGVELLIPVLANMPFAKSLDFNGAARFTNYTTSGSVWTWKMGGSYQVNDQLRFRLTTSKDIRAPELYDLYAPTSTTFSSFQDLKTGITQGLETYSQGNPHLVPEEGRTFTVGAVFQPKWVPRFSLSVDYYDINVKNAITVAAPSNLAYQTACIQSGGTSPYCQLIVRPTPTSFPSYVLSEDVNAAKLWTNGVDIEANYRFDMADVFSKLPGSVRLRALGSYQPTLETLTVNGVAPVQNAGVAGNDSAPPTSYIGVPKVRVNFNVSYLVNDWTFTVVNRWESQMETSDPTLNVDTRNTIPAYDYTDISIEFRGMAWGHQFAPFLTIENLFNIQPPNVGGSAGAPSLFYSAAPGYDVMGRYFTMGVRATF